MLTATTDPAAPALDDGARRFRHGELAGAIAGDAGWLRRAGIGRAAVRAGNGCGWVIADRALAAAGLPRVPLPPAFTDAQLRHALDDAGIDALLTDEPALAGRLAAGFTGAGRLPAAGLGVWRRPRPATPPALPPGTVKVTYTSGSTGTPKGVCLTAATLDAVVASVLAATRDLALRRHLALLPLATLLEDVAGLGASLAAGGECLLPGTDRTGLGADGVDVARLTALVAAAAPHSLILVPELLQALVLAAGAGWTPPGSLRFIAVGGARVSPALLARATALGLPVHEGYGLSECGSVLCLSRPGATRPGSVGQPLAHVRLRVDARGELHVAAPAFAGYLGGEQPAAEFATGDLGRIDADGFVYVDGRAKNLLITSLGRNVSPEWVEGELLRQPAIAQACVAGDDRPYLTAVIVPRTPGADVVAAVASANATLPDYAQVRRQAVVTEPFTPANGLLTANGRPRRDRILSRHGALIDSLYPAPAGAATGT